MPGGRAGGYLCTSGWALILVFVITVLAAAMPLQIASTAWGINLSTRIADAASLALVGLCLVRFGDHVQSQSATSEEFSALRFKRLCRLLAVAGTSTLMLLAIWQIPLFFTALRGIDQQAAAASSEAVQRSDAIAEALSQASPAQISQGWEQLRRQSVQAPEMSELSAASQREELLSRAKEQSKNQLLTLRQQAASARLQLGRDRLRVALAALVYGWAFLTLRRSR